MKKLITLLAVFGVATTAYADDHMKQNGSFRVIYNNTNNTTNFDDNTGDKKKDIMQRLIWAPTFKVSDAVSVHATLVHSSVWGNNEDQIPGGQNNENDSLIVNEAYANWMVNDESMIRVGRGSYTAADGRVISANSWEQVAKAFEGLMYSHDAEFARAGLFAVRGATGNGSNDSGNFFGANIDFKNLPEFFKMANLHYIIVKRDASTYPNLGALSKEDSTREKQEIPFKVGDSVRVVDGPFNDFKGVVEEINEEKMKIKVMVSIFGRSTPVELDFMQVVIEE